MFIGFFDALEGTATETLDLDAVLGSADETEETTDDGGAFLSLPARGRGLILVRSWSAAGFGAIKKE